MAFDQAEIEKMLNADLVPSWMKEKRRLDDIDRWARWDHTPPHSPRQATSEHKALAGRAQVPWGDLVVTTVTQTLYVIGYRRPSDPDDGAPWRTWQANGMDARQIALHRAALTYGLAYGVALPGSTLTGERLAQMFAVSPRQMIALYDDVAQDQWPQIAMRVIPGRGGRARVVVYDDQHIHTFEGADGADGKLTHVGAEEHGAGVCPVVRFANRFDLEGRSTGEVEPFVPLFGSIEQTKYDRLNVQRFASWVVRTISGMSIDETAKATNQTEDQVMMRLRANDILVSADPDTKFGSLPATDLPGFISAHEADVRELAAVSQTPAHEMLGMMANLSAEALAAAKASQTAKSEGCKTVFGESHEQWLRLTAHLEGNADAAADFQAEVRWKDTEIRSMAQAADALGKLAQMLGVPVELLWEKIPGFSEQDVDRAKAMVQDDAISRLFADLDRQMNPAATVGA